LDPIGCREIKDLIKALAKRGKTVILSSHLLSDVEDVCDRVVIYYGGRVQAFGTLKELLMTPDVTRITTPVLPRETMDKVLQIIRKDVDEAKISIDNPTQNLESYFLGVVEKARQDEATTSGAVSGNRVAAYLAADAEKGASPDKVLDRLTKAGSEASEPTEAVESASASSVDESKLAGLAQPEDGNTPKVEVAPKPAADLEKANEKLSSLLDSSSPESKDDK
jgi:ABC-2 type transport system ATP-binding protein